MYKSILIPLDGSEYAARAACEVTQLAGPESKVTLVRVVPSVDDLMGTRQPDPADDMEKSDDVLAREAYEDELRAAYADLDTVLQMLTRQGLTVASRAETGEAIERITGVAKEIQADLIIIAAHGRSAHSTPPKNGVFGRVADGILKASSSPVLVVKP